jgi:hypothetical protein
MQCTPEQLEVLREHLVKFYGEDQLDRLSDSDAPAMEVAAALAEHDFGFFCRFYLAEHFSDRPAGMHFEIYDEVQSAIEDAKASNHAIAWPRGFGKSTTMATAVIAWCIVGVIGSSGEREPRKHYTLLVMDSGDQAQLHLASLKTELVDNEYLTYSFGQLKGPTWGAEEIVTSNGVMVQALGSGKKIRGRKFGPHRPDLIIADDLENDENVLSPTQRTKQRSWFYRALMHAGGPSCDVFFVGTILHYDCLLVHALKDPRFRSRKYRALISEPQHQELWDDWTNIYANLSDPDRIDKALEFYESNEIAMLEGAEVAWPDRFPLLRLQTMRLQDDDEELEVGSFDAEMQNEPLDASKAHFKNIFFWYEGLIDGEPHFIPYERSDPVPIRECRLFGALDPSMGATERADLSAIIDGFVAPSGQLFVAWADIARRTPDDTIDDVFYHAEFWKRRGIRYTTFVIETNGFQQLMKSKAVDEALERRMPIPFDDAKSNKPKPLRISSLQPDLTNGFILLKKERGQNVPKAQRILYDQLRFWPLAGKQDGPDALEMLRTVARTTPEVLMGFI